MAEQQTIMERLFHTLDEKAKTLNNENGQSFIENLGLAMEQVYTNERGLLEQSTLQDRRKSIPICIFKFNAGRKDTNKSSNYTRFNWIDTRIFS